MAAGLQVRKNRLPRPGGLGVLFERFKAASQFRFDG